MIPVTTEDKPFGPGRPGAGWYVLLAFLLLGLGIGLMPWGAVAGLDGPNYLTGADSLARGVGYRVVDAIGTPPLSTYPPLQAALLSLVYRLAPAYPANQIWLRMEMLVLSVTGLLLLFRALAVRGLPWSVAAGITLLLGSSGTWSALVGNFMAEPLFLILTGLMACWSEPGRIPAVPDPHACRWWAVLGLLSGLMYLARSAAAGIVLGILVAALFSGWWRRPIAAVSFAVPFGLLSLVWLRMPKVTSGGYGAYFSSRFEELGYWSGYLRHAGLQALDYAGGYSLVTLLSDVLGRGALIRMVQSHGWSQAFLGLVWGVALLAMALAVRGFCTKRQDGDAAAATVIGFYFLQIVVWPAFMGPRGAVFLLPWFCAWIWRGVERHGSKCLRRSVLCILPLIAVGNFLFARTVRHDQMTVRSVDMEPIAGWLRQQDPGAIVGIDYGISPYEVFTALGRPVLYGVESRQTRYLPVPQPPGLRARFVVGPTRPLRSSPLLSNAPVVFSGPKFRVLEVPASAAQGDTPAETRR